MVETATRSEMAESMMSLIMIEVNRIIAASLSRRIIIYGAGARGIVLCEIFKSVGHDVAYFLDSNKKNTNVCDVPVYEPTHIMNEEFDEIFVVVAADCPDELIKNLKSYGLDTETTATCIFDRKSLDNGTSPTPPPTAFDFFLGYTRIYELPGFTYLGSGNPNDVDDLGSLRIVTLGNSTTDPYVTDPIEQQNADNGEYATGSWPRVLHELLNLRGIKNCIYNGGMSGYTSAQETLKLIRDGLTLKPDIILTLDGINDGISIYWHQKKYPKFNSYFKVLERAIKPLLSTPSSNSENGFINTISYGIETDVSAYDEWYSNQRIMRAVCNEFDIQYVEFLQPGCLHSDDYLQSCDVRFRTRYFIWNFFNTTGRILSDLAGDKYPTLPNGIELRELLSSFNSNVFDFEVDGRTHFNIRFKTMEDFYLKAKAIASKCDYIIDITDTFNGFPDVIYDTAHCT